MASQSFAKGKFLRLVSPLLLALSGLFASQPVVAQGDLLVAPTRVILDGRRGTEVILSNIGSEDADYRITLELRRMTEDGSLVEVEDGAANDKEKAALEMIRYAPRRITLPPGQPQAVRISARPGPELPEGEYRAHMTFRAIPRPRPVTEEPPSTGGVSINLVPIYGITIPIIVRHGKVEAQATMTQPMVAQGARGPELQFSINRQGESSTYGELRATKPGLKDPIVQVTGIAVYPELTRRDVALALTPEQAAALHGNIHFEYREMPEAGGGLIAAVDASL